MRLVLFILLVLSAFQVSAQNFGIGTTNPTAKLHVTADIRLDGPLRPNGDPGTAGQYLVSQGAGSAPVWQSVTPSAGSTQFFKKSATRTTITGAAFVLVPGLTQNITLAANATVMISTYGALQTSASSGGGSGVIMQVFVDGVAVANFSQTIDVIAPLLVANTISPWSMTNYVTLAAGAHTIEVRTRKYDPAVDDYTVGGYTIPTATDEGALVISVFN